MNLGHSTAHGSVPQTEGPEATPEVASSRQGVCGWGGVLCSRIPKGCALYKLHLHSSEHEPATTARHNTEGQTGGRAGDASWKEHVPAHHVQPRAVYVSAVGSQTSSWLVTLGGGGAGAGGGAVTLPLHLGLGAESGSFCADPRSQLPFVVQSVISHHCHHLAGTGTRGCVRGQGEKLGKRDRELCTIFATHGVFNDFKTTFFMLF